MSEYQWVEFRAVDAPLDDAALEFMQDQSTRAEIDRWRFTNEYHWGEFCGDVSSASQDLVFCLQVAHLAGQFLVRVR